MQYRKLGKTGVNVSEIGYGGEHLEGKSFELVDSVINAALDGGVNIMDVFMPQPEVRSNIGRAIGDRRKDVLLQGHIGAAMDNGQYHKTRDVKKCDEFVKDFMTRLNTDYIDIGMMHFIDTEEDFKAAFESDYIEYVQKLKKSGTIRFIGVSCHHAPTAIKMINTGLIDVIMFSVNPAFDLSAGTLDLDTFFEGKKLDRMELDPVRTEFYNLCEAKGVAITVMKTLGAGRLLNAEASNLGYALTVPQCVSFALDRPAVSSVMMGAQTPEEVRTALNYENTSAEERDYTVVMKSGLPLTGGKCMYCNHCLPCPQGIDVAGVTKHLDRAKTAGIDKSYFDLERTAADCIKCGSCESRCPFGVPVMKNMDEAIRVFGK